MRRVVFTISFLALLVLAVGLITHLMNTYRQGLRIQQHHFVSLLRLAAHGLNASLQDADTVRAPRAEDIRRLLPPFAFEQGRHFIIVDADGHIRAIAGEQPTPHPLLRPGRLLPHPLRRIALAANGTVQLTRVKLADGAELLAGAVPLGAWPGAVMLVQRAGISPFVSHAGMLLLLFLGMFVVTVALASIYGWQSARAEAESERRSEFVSRLETALQLGRCGLWDWDISRGRIYLSPSMRRLLNLPAGEGYTDLQDFLALQHPADPPIHRLLEEGLQQGRRTFEHELRLRHADGRWIWVKMRGALPENTRDGTYHLVGIAVDITEQKHASKAMRNAEKRLIQAIESISESFALWDEHMRMVACNSKFREFFGLTEQACASGRSQEEVMHGAANPACRRLAPRTPGDGAQQESIAELELADGRWLQISDRHIPGVGFVSVGTDITELKRKQMELEHSERELQETVQALEHSRLEIEHKNIHLKTLARRFRQEKERAEDALRTKSQFLANISHELFTPLNHIILSADAMHNQSFGALNEKYLDYARRIRDAGREVGRKIRDMLEYAELSTAGARVRPQATDIGALMNDIGEHFLPAAKRKGIRLSWHVPEGLEGRIDPDLAQKALMRLVANAVRFTDEGEVEISVHTNGKGELVFEVCDTGKGIPADKIAQIGQPFERPGNPYNSHSGGSGIGLAIAKAVAEKHGGRLEITSREGAGTRVRLILPDAECAAACEPAD